MKDPLEILVTNDDGIHAPGLCALAQAASKIGNVTVIAPDKNWSASGHQKALGRPLRVEQVPFDNGISAYMTDGGPSDCTALVGLGFLKKRVDLVLTGINPTANVSRDITYSGTVTSALEATIWNMKGIAFSIDANEVKPDQIDFSAAKEIIIHVVQTYLKHELPPFTILNVNIPYLPLSQIRGYKITRGGSRYYRDELVSCVDPFGRPYYWFGGLPPYGDEDEGTDCGELSRGYVSITPIHLDLTAYEMMPAIQKWEWNGQGDNVL
ncbi:MAG: 5'/3'-nucleotidase SurE [Flexilinea flocculi]|jgi:5'-nucleotidase|nr:5'/3'-nucleotidase SurE [Flexilinea flocculi]